MKTKICTKCKTEYLATTEYFRQTKYYLRGECKNCERNQSKEYSLNNKKKLQKWRIHNREKNKKKLNEITRQWRLNNKEKIKINGKLYKTLHKKEYSDFEKNNRIMISYKRYSLNTCNETIKPILNALIVLKNKNKLLKELKNEHE